jgi:hypothetical protein
MHSEIRIWYLDRYSRGFPATDWTPWRSGGHT